VSLIMTFSIFLIKTFQFLVSCLQTFFAVLPENSKLKLLHWPIVLTNSIDYRIIGLLHNHPNT